MINGQDAQDKGSPFQHRFWQAFYDRAAALYDAVLDLGARLGIGSETTVRRQVIAALPIKPDEPVLDIGCGTAENRMFLDESHSYIGLDISRGMLRRAQAKCAQNLLSASFVQADAIALPFRRGVFASAVAMGVLQHVAQSGHALAEMRRVSVVTGEILIIDELRASNRLEHRIGMNSSLIIGDYFVWKANPI
ncbi:MAG: class I SAM-dependent methyltransferase [Anaerolineales bacterium]